MPTDAETVQDAEIEPIFSIGTWATNAEMMAYCRRLGYFPADASVLDCTYGEGNFWTEFEPEDFVGCDLNPAKSPYGAAVDFTDMPWYDEEFHTVVFDPPYKLNGTPDPVIDEKYGVEKATPWQERMQLIHDGTIEAARVCHRWLMVKVSDQVCSGDVRWQTGLVTNILGAFDFIDEEGRFHAKPAGDWRLRDRLDFMSYRKQPSGTRQVHSRSNSSTLLIFERIR